MALNTLNDLLCNRLGDIYDAESQLATAWPEMAEGASDSELKSLFRKESGVVRDQISRLDGIFATLRISKDSVISKGMRGIIEEGREILQEMGDSRVKDAALISIAQEMKHYELAAYGSVRAWAKDLDEPKAATLLRESLHEEGSMDKKLTSLAEGGMMKKGINRQAPK